MLQMPRGGFEPVEDAPLKLNGHHRPKPKAKPKDQSGRFEMLNAVADFRIHDMPRSTLAVWLLIFRDARGNVASVSYTDLARRAGCSRAAVIRGVKDLIDRKLLKRLTTGNNLTHQASKYELLRP